jgi:hypothetical protein
MSSDYGSIHHAAGHPTGCDCDKCQSRQKLLSDLDLRSELKWRARADAAYESSIPGLTVRLQQLAKVERDTARLDVERFQRIRKPIRDEIGRATRKLDDLASTPGALNDKENYRQFSATTQRIKELRERDREFGRMERKAEKRADKAERARVSVTAEPRVYGLDSEHSYYRDVAVLGSGEAEPQMVGAAQQRMDRYDSELRHEMQRGSREGKRALRMIRESTRVEREDKHRKLFHEAEKRALTTGGGMTASASGAGVAAFVTPIVFDDQFALFREPQRTFADQCGTAPLPAYGMQAYVPAFSSPAAAAQHSEGAAVTETDPTTVLNGSAVGRRVLAAFGSVPGAR